MLAEELRAAEARLRGTEEELARLFVQNRELNLTRARFEGALRILRPDERPAIAAQLAQVGVEGHALEARIQYLRGRKDQLERDVYAGRLRARNEAQLARRIRDRLQQLGTARRAVLDALEAERHGLHELRDRYTLRLRTGGALITAVTPVLMEPGDQRQFDRLMDGAQKNRVALNEIQRELHVLEARLRETV